MPIGVGKIHPGIDRVGVLGAARAANLLDCVLQQLDRLAAAAAVRVSVGKLACGLERVRVIRTQIRFAAGRRLFQQGDGLVRLLGPSKGDPNIAHRFQGIAMLRPKHVGAPLQHRAIEQQGGVQPVRVAIRVGQGLHRRQRIEMVKPELRLGLRQRRLQQRDGLGVLPFHPIRGAETDHRLQRVRMIRPQRRAAFLQYPLVERQGLIGIAIVAIGVGERGHRGERVRVIGTQRNRALVQQFLSMRHVVFRSRVGGDCYGGKRPDQTSGQKRDQHARARGKRGGELAGNVTMTNTSGRIVSVPHHGKR